MKTYKREFGTNDIGCYADGSLGHDHCRDVLRWMLEDHFHSSPEISSIIAALYSDMSDDAWEEDEALRLLNTATIDDTLFEFYDGDLILSGLEREAQ